MSVLLHVLISFLHILIRSCPRLFSLTSEMSQQLNQGPPNDNTTVVTISSTVTEEEAIAAKQVLQYLQQKFPRSNPNDVSHVKVMLCIIIHLEYIFSLCCFYLC